MRSTKQGLSYNSDECRFDSFCAMATAITLRCAVHCFATILALMTLCGGGFKLSAQPLNLQWQSANGFRYADLPVLKSNKTGFSRVDAASSGVFFTNLLSAERSMTNSPLNNGSGVAAGDVDGDGWCDLYLCGLENANSLYRNLGNGRFQDITDRAGVACAGQFSTGAVLADLDGDGDLDLLVNALGGGTRVFLNDGMAHFAEVTEQAGLASHAASMALALADFDGDGTLDLYVTNYRSKVLTDEPNIRFTIHVVDGTPQIVKVNGAPVTDPELVGRFSFSPTGGPQENGEADALYRGDGKGHFVPVAWTTGIFLDEENQHLPIPPYDWGLGVIFRDLNGDGLPDLYVCNDAQSPDRIWINDGKGHFHAAPRLAVRKTSLSSMGVDVADIDRDGFDDIFVLDMLSRSHQRRLTQREGVKPPVLRAGQIDDRPQYPRNMLFLNHGDGTYAEIAQFSGLDASEWSWTPIFLDVDLDGFEDLLISTGFIYDVRDVDANQRINALKAQKTLTSREQLLLRRYFPKYHTSQLAFRNRGDLSFEEVSAAWGFNEVGVGQGMCLADFDNDGDLDVVVNKLNGVAGIYRNETSAPRVAVRLKGLVPNTRGIGAKISLLGGAVPVQSQEMICGGRYLSGDDAMRVFAAGSQTHEMQLEVRWRSGKRSVVNGVKANRIYEIAEAPAMER
jgi:hypothetical protein